MHEYDPAIYAPRDIEQYNKCIDYWYKIEEDKAKDDVKYKPLTREQIEEKFSCYYPTNEIINPIITEKTISELFFQLRSIRSDKLAKYDSKVLQLAREKRMGIDVDEKLSDWDMYANSLCKLPNQPGAPWDGGGPLTPWPVEPDC